MGLLRTIASAFNKRILVEETIRTQERIYEREKRRHPELEPHDLLARVLLTRMATRGLNIRDPEVRGMAYGSTWMFACLPHPECVKVLALYILYKDVPSAIVAKPEFVSECEELMRPLEEAVEGEAMPWESQTLRDLYALYNPGRAAEME